MRLFERGHAMRASAVVVIVAAAATLAAGAAFAQTKAASPMQQTIAFDKQNVQPKKHYKIAFLSVCVTANPYCQKMVQGTRDAAKKYGVDLKVYDANFNPADQLKQVQDALTQNYDGYILFPAQDALGCKLFKMLQKAKKPIASGNSPMCGSDAYTPGTIGFVGTSTQIWFTRWLDWVFGQCKGANCELAAIGGIPGFDADRRWQNAIKAAKAKHPNVKVVVNQPAMYDAQKAYQITQDALQAHPNIRIIVSGWDDMSRGIENAVKKSGKKLNKDVLIESEGGNAHGVADVKAGLLASTIIVQPYEEGYYPIVQLIKFLETGKTTPGFADVSESPSIVNGPGSSILTAANVAKYKAQY